MSEDKKKQALKEKIESDNDYVYIPRLGNSLQNLISKHPEGVDDETIAKVLLITKEEVAEIFESAMTKLRKILKLEE